MVLATAPHTAVMLPTVAAGATALLRPCRPTAFVLTACSPRAPEVAEAEAALAPHGMLVAPVRLGERRAYARAVAGSRAVTAFAPRGKAAQEITALWRWVQAQLLSGEGARV